MVEQKHVCASQMHFVAHDNTSRNLMNPHTALRQWSRNTILKGSCTARTIDILPIQRLTCETKSSTRMRAVEQVNGKVVG